MTFTNISGIALYLTCCHREVEPAGTFSVPWESAKRDRALRAAMNDGRLAWREDAGEAKVPRSPRVPDFNARAKAARAAQAKAQAEADAKTAAEKAEAERAVQANMARRGRYDVPQPVKREVQAKRVATEKPVTRADVITSGKPKSLADIRRHNKAVQQFKP